MTQDFIRELVSELKRDPHLKEELRRLLEVERTPDYVNQGELYDIESKVEDLEEEVEEIQNSLKKVGDLLNNDD